MVKDDDLLPSVHFFLSGCRAEFKITDFGVKTSIETLALPVINSVAFLSFSFLISKIGIITPKSKCYGED